MRNLTEILENTIGKTNASSFAKRYSKDINGVIKEYEGNIKRTDFKEGTILASRKRQFVNARKGYDGLVVIPYEHNCSGHLVTYRDSNYQMKKLPLLPLFRDKTKQEAIKYRSAPGKKFATSLRMARLEDHFVGYDFMGIRDKRVRTVSFGDAIEGKRISDEFKAELDSNDYNNHAYSIMNGGKVNARVQSLSEDRKHSFKVNKVAMRLSGKPIPKDAYANWSEINSNHDCGKVNYGGLSFFRYVKNLKMNSLSKREASDELKQCHHVIAAIKTYNRVRSKTKVALDPFIEFKAQALDFYDKLKNNTLMEVYENGKIKLKPLGEANLNVMMFNYLKLNPSQAYFRT